MGNDIVNGLMPDYSAWDLFTHQAMDPFCICCGTASTGVGNASSSKLPVLCHFALKYKVAENRHCDRTGERTGDGLLVDPTSCLHHTLHMGGSVGRLVGRLRSRHARGPTTTTVSPAVFAETINSCSIKCWFSATLHFSRLHPVAADHHQFCHQFCHKVQSGGEPSI